MSTPSQPPVTGNPWTQLRRFTAARIALGRAGISLPTQPQLAFQLAHAQARDAVHLALDVDQLLQDVRDANLLPGTECVVLDSAAASRLQYLQRPDLGRRLNHASVERLKSLPGASPASRPDVAFVLADGLSALAVAQNAVPLLVSVMRLMSTDNYRVAPLVIVRQGRVAVGDEVAALLGARLVVLLIGERPGLSSPDSLGAYLTWAPAVGLTDASRNCISNIRPAGLNFDDAADKIRYLVTEMMRREVSGVALKDESQAPGALDQPVQRNFLLENGEGD
ncbi:MAG: ethanolamine ammonia-lyase subunit EutC [Polaromonas sp.]